MTTFRLPLFATLILFSGCLILGIGAAIKFHSKPSFESAWAARLKSDDSIAKQIVKSRLDDPEFRDPRTLLQAGLLLRQGRAADAAKKLQQIGPEWNVRPETRQLWGETFYALGQLPDAEREFLALLREDPSRGETHLWLAAIYYDQMRFDDFLRESKRSMLLAPEDYRPHRLLGLSYHRFYRFSESAQHFQEALRLGGISGQEDIVCHLAQAQLFNRDYTSVEELIAKIPEPTGEMWALLAEARLNLGSDDKVVNECIDQALKTGRHDRRTLQLASQIFIDTGRAEEAIEFLNEILATAPHYERAHYLLSRAYLKLGRQEDYERSIAQFQAAEKIKREHDDLIKHIVQHPDDAEALNRAEFLANQMGEPELAKLYSIANASRSSPRMMNR